MSTTIGDLAVTDKPEAIALVAPYVDTIEVSSRRSYPSALLKAIKASSGSMLPDVACDADDPDTIWHYLLAINQPSPYCIDLLQWYHENIARLSIYRLHVAFDVINIAPGYTRAEVIEVFSKLCHLRHRRAADEMHDEEGTLYSIKTAGRKTRPYRNTGLYTTKPSKITGECDAIHFEAKLERKRSTERVIDEPADLLRLRPAEFFAKQIAVKDIRPIMEKIIQRSIKAHRPHPLMPIERRIRAMFRRYRWDHASGFAGMFKKQFERIPHWDCIDVEDTLNWAHADVRCDREVGKLHCLLPPRRRPHRERLIIRERL